MKLAIWFPSLFSFIVILSGCSNSGGDPGNDFLGTGPFDKNGTYREDWADDPSKWRKPNKRDQASSPAEDVPLISKNEQPPADANPLASGTALPQKDVAKKEESSPRQTVRRAEENSQTAKKIATTASKPKPKPVVVKAQAKPKPKATTKPSRYVVKSGDSLSSIAARNGTSVSALRKANGISGSMIRPGQSLSLPKR